MKGHSYTLVPLPPSQIKSTIQIDREGNISEKASIFSEGLVEGSISKGKTIYPLCMLGKGEGETSLHSPAKTFVVEFWVICLSHLAIGLPPSNGIEHQIELLPILGTARVSHDAELKAKEIKELYE